MPHLQEQIETSGYSSSKVNPIVEFCENVIGLSNDAHAQIADYLESMPIAHRARFIERCNSMAAFVAETMTDEE
jgi:hypothetical protein